MSSGEEVQNVVFFDNVRVPKANRIGEENQGWTVAKYLLEFERGGGSGAGLKVALERLRSTATAERAGDGAALMEEADFRARLAQLAIRVDAIEMAEHRVMTALSAGKNPGPASSMLKVQGTEAMQAIDELAVEALGFYAAPDQPQARTPGSNVAPIGPAHGLTLVPRYLNNRASTIYGGSNEIQRDIMAKLVLGL